jgi:hypothetical protein
MIAAPDTEARTALHDLAAEGDHVATVKMVLARGVSLGLKAEES